MPSTTNSVCVEDEPRMKTEVWPPGAPVLTMFTPGTAASAVRRSATWARSSLSSGTTSTLLVVNWASCGVRVALTT